jgi:Glycosyl transferase family 2
VRVAMTLVVRDEADLVEDWLRYHLALGVDQLIVTDHRSVDGTPEVLARYAGDRVRVIREDAHEMQQAEWVTRMARLAATDHRADWVINSDADEFWWPRDASVHELLAAVPARFGIVRALWRQFVLRPDGPSPFWERMTVRRRPVAELASPYHAQVKIAHRATADVVVSEGNHDAYGVGALVREWLPFEVLHFPLRTEAQLADKFLRRRAILGGEHIAAAIGRLDSDGPAAFHRSLLFDDPAVEQGLANGTLVEDVRLRDALTTLRAGETTLPTWTATLADDVDLTLDFQSALERDSRVGLDRRAAALERAIARLEGSMSLASVRR